MEKNEIANSPPGAAEQLSGIWRQIFEDHEDWIRDTATSIISDHRHFDPDDFSQDVIIACYFVCCTLQAKNKAIESPHGLFRHVANCKLVAYYRKNYKKLSAISITSQKHQMNRLRDMEKEHDPYFIMEMSELSTWLKQALSTLTEQQRNAFLMLLQDDARHEDIARELNISITRSTTIRQEARRKLKTAFPVLDSYGGIFPKREEAT